MNWYRVQLNSHGALVSCSEVESAGDESPEAGSIHYVMAETSTDAAGQAYERYKANQRILLKARREKNKAEGLCRCGRANVPPHATCPTCRERRRSDHDRMERRRAGEYIETPSKAIAFAKAKDERANNVALETLIEVRRAWAESTNGRAFAIWLSNRILELGGQR